MKTYVCNVCPNEVEESLLSFLEMFPDAGRAGLYFLLFGKQRLKLNEHGHHKHEDLAYRMKSHRDKERG